MKYYPRISDELNRYSITKLLDNELDVIHIEGFYPHELSKKFAEKITTHAKLEAYQIQNTVSRLGMGYIDVGKDPKLAKQYHDEAVDSIWLIRNLIYPYLSPLDHMRLLLQEIWPAGANIEHINNKKCFVGTCRFFKPNVKLKPHNDRFARLLFDGDTINIKGQLAVNIYLDMLEEGGDLELWLTEPSKEQDKIIGIMDGVDREGLPPPKLLIKPSIGDLVIFNSELLHNVTPGTGHNRVSISSFIGYRGQHKPLTYWS